MNTTGTGSSTSPAGTPGIGAREPAWGVFFFGTIIGGLLAFTTTAGITATVIGLIFTLIGGSFLAWFQPNKLDDQQRSALLRYMGLLGLGLWAGLLLGFLLRGVEDYWIRPIIIGKWKRDLGITPEAVKPGEPNPSSVPAPIFQTQATLADYKKGLRDLEDELKTNKELSKDDHELLEELKEHLRKLIGTMETADKRKLQQRLSEKAQDAMKKIVISPPE